MDTYFPQTFPITQNFTHKKSRSKKNSLYLYIRRLKISTIHIIISI
ncbi:hypothetical protein SAMN05421594_1402 [Chryseobacterium oleae]|uniref:Uncharacterized protein n=1 Tax=Chryseobacterium oleae TaxID=491207 RepID=A0A1I4WPY6_CHROL|nr:hypothetical protein SAMN05421594_1402 [Chryseobacterium oleae]